MPVLSVDADGVERAARELDAGRAVVLPGPTPLPYVVAGRDAAAVNLAKGRPAGQPCGMVVADLAQVRPHLDLDAGALAFAGWLTGTELVNLFLPTHPDVPARLWPSISDGRLALTLAFLDPLRGLLGPSGHLYLSSGNRTGGREAVTAVTANTEFGDELTVLDGDGLRDPGTPSGSATILAFDPDGGVRVARSGIQVAHHGGDPQRYLEDVTRRWAAARAG